MREFNERRLYCKKTILWKDYITSRIYGKGNVW